MKTCLKFNVLQHKLSNSAVNDYPGLGPVSFFATTNFFKLFCGRLLEQFQEAHHDVDFYDICNINISQKISQENIDGQSFDLISFKRDLSVDLEYLKTSRLRRPLRW